ISFPQVFLPLSPGLFSPGSCRRFRLAEFYKGQKGLSKALELMSLLTISLLTIAACALFISRRPSDATHASNIVSRGALALVLCLVAAGYLQATALAQRAAVPPDARGTGPSQQTLAHHEGGEANL